jgi:23S rRNA pseudouridine2604 synthase
MKPRKQTKRPQEKKLKTPAPLTEATFPMRINKYLALKKFTTRRGADLLITQKKVYINGVRAVLGDKVEETDKVEVRLKANTPNVYTYVAYHKPIDLITSAQSKNEKDIVRSLPPELKKYKLFPLGRLDKNSHGLIILSNDGRITDRLLNPRYEHEKQYEVRVHKPLRRNFKERIEKGINIEGYVTKPAKVRIIDPHTFVITLTEGKTHQIRRMVSALFNEVADLKRIRIMNVELGELKPGAYRILEGEESAEFLQSLFAN